MMKEYPKINSIFKRDDKGRFIIGQYSEPEFEYLKDLPWEATEKIDGTNIRVIWDEDGRRFGGKTDNAKIPVFLYNQLCQMFPIDNPFEYPVCLYGEGYGNKIQKSGSQYIPNGVSFILFDVLINGYWLERQNIVGIAAKLGIQAVPFIDYLTLDQATRYTAEGIKSWFGSFTAEGLVLKPMRQLFNRHGQRIITKVKHRDFR